MLRFSLALLLSSGFFLVAEPGTLLASRADDEARPASRTPRGLDLAESQRPAITKKVVGTVEPFDPDLPTGSWQRQGAGWAWEHSLTFDGATFVKLRIEGLDLRPGDRLETWSEKGQVETLWLDGPADGAPFWTLAVAGDRTTLRLRSERPYASLPLRIVRVALGGSALGGSALGRPDHGQVGQSMPEGGEGDFVGGRAAERSLCGEGDFENAACYRGDAAKWTNILATAGILTIEGESVVACTGVAVSPRDHVLTTHTCVPDAATCIDSEVIFGLYRDGCVGEPPIAEGWRGYRCSEVVVSSPFEGRCEPDSEHLDFALLRVDGRPVDEWGYVDPSTATASSGDALYIPQATGPAAGGGARPLEIVHGDGADVVVEPTVLRYFGSLDTESPGVGAPIFDEVEDRLLGLHHCGGCSTPDVGNRGVPMAAIRPQIEGFLCEPEPTLEAGTAGQPSPVTGNGDGVLDPGEVWSFVPAVRNPTCDDGASSGAAGPGAAGPGADIVRARFAVAAGSAPIELLDSVADFGPIARGATVDGTAVRFRLLGDAPCAGRVEIEMSQIERATETYPGDPAHLAVEVGEVLEIPLLSEDFADGLPPGWGLVDGGSGDGPSSTWTTDDPGSRQLLEPPFAIVDSEHLGPDATMDEILSTPLVDTSSRAHSRLRFRHDFRWFEDGLDERADVEVRSAATAGTWTLLERFTGEDRRGPVELDLGPYRAMDLEIRFRYWNAQWEWWWAIDDVEIVGDDGPSCFTGLLVDGFESGNLDAWSNHAPPLGTRPDADDLATAARNGNRSAPARVD